MRNALETLEATFLEMRWRTLSLAADLDRVQRSDGGASAMNDHRLSKLRQAFEVLLNAKQDRAAQVQMIFSDRSERIADSG